MNSGCEEKKRPVLSQTLEIFPECALSSPHAQIVALMPPVRMEGKHEEKEGTSVRLQPANIPDQ